MIKNNKGFMLAEVVIVSTVIITTLVALYKSFNKIYVLYDNRNNYYNIDGIYAGRVVANYLFNNDKLNNMTSAPTFGNYLFLVTNGSCTANTYLDNNICLALVDLYKIKNIVFTKANNTYKKEGTNELYFGKNNLTLNPTFKDYLKYVANHYSGFYGIEDSYLIIIEYGQDNNNLYYSNLILR